MAVCASETELNYASYNNEDCSGDPASINDITLFFFYSSYTIQCCSGNLCSTSIEREYEPSQAQEGTCTWDINDATFDEDVYTIDACLGESGKRFKYTSCINDTSTRKWYINNDPDDCDGTPDSMIITPDGYCDPDYYQYEVACTEAIDTCPTTTNTTESTSPNWYFLRSYHYKTSLIVVEF